MPVSQVAALPAAYTTGPASSCLEHLASLTMAAEEPEAAGDYVKFSKEKYILDSSPEKLHKELEEELKLSSTDLRSHAWYHGRIPREVSETLVQRNGDFLIRDSLTSLGDYVLTCRWRNQALHFKINKVVVKAGQNYTHIQYLFEQESFDHVPALVRYHVGSRKAVSEQSGAIIYCPVNRTFPLRYLEASYGLSQAGGKAASPASPSGPKGSHMKRRSVTVTDGLTADKLTRDACPASASPAHPRDSIRNCALSMDQIPDLHSPMSPISESPSSPAYSTGKAALTRRGSLAAPRCPRVSHGHGLFLQPWLAEPLHGGGQRLSPQGGRARPCQGHRGWDSEFSNHRRLAPELIVRAWPADDMVNVHVALGREGSGCQALVQGFPECLGIGEACQRPRVLRAGAHELRSALGWLLPHLGWGPLVAECVPSPKWPARTGLAGL
uniref:SH2 domain-containing protein n=1 Tax=Oryctolagus cuniculus TaxID=9986 RepID=A0A5F9DT97_RABIT